MRRTMACLALALACVGARGDEGAQPHALTPEPLYTEIARKYAGILPEEHLLHTRLNDRMAAYAWTNYLAALDFDRMYFTQADIEFFRPAETELDDQLKDGDVTFAYTVFERFKQRVRERCDYVDVLIAKGFDLDKDESYRWKRKDAPWATDETALNELWRKRIKNEYVSRLVSKELRETNAVATNAVANADEQAEPEEKSPEEEIRNAYRRYLTVLEDSDAEFVLEKYLTAFATAYDPHSAYMSPSSVADFDIEMGLSLVGIGALLRAEEGAAKIERLIPGGPADRVKGDNRLRPGDRIVAVAQGDGKSVDILHWPLTKVVKKIRGEKGTKVVLTIIPASDPTGATRRKVAIIRDEVKLEEQAAKSDVRELRLEDGTVHKLGVITLPAFYANLNAESEFDPAFRSSSRDVDKLIRQLKQQDVEGIALDLRGNGGGSLPEAVNMTGLFIDSGPVVLVKELFGTTRLTDDDPYVAYSGPLVVLVNRLSASASEILAGALKDYGRAVIVGDSKTHGKGTVQSVTQLGNDKRMGSVKITSWMFYRVCGDSTQLKGVEPDIVIPSLFETMELGEEYLPHAMAWDRVRPAKYQPWADLGGVIPTLKSRSEARRKVDPRFINYLALLDRIRAMNESKELPLAFKPRKTLAIEEKELTDLQERLMRENGADANGDPKDEKQAAKDEDLVLEEGLRILCDLSALTSAEKGGGTAPAQPPAPAAAGTAGRAPAGRVESSTGLWMVLPIGLLVLAVPAVIVSRRLDHDR